jgi:hypothetical protein
MKAGYVLEPRLSISEDDKSQDEDNATWPQKGDNSNLWG